MTKPCMKLVFQIKLSMIVLFIVMATTGTVFCSSALADASNEAATASQVAETSGNNDTIVYGLIAAAVAFGLGALASGYAISHVGAAAMGAVAEKPEIAGQALIFVALAEGLVVFGFITALMILNKV